MALTFEFWSTILVYDHQGKDNHTQQVNHHYFFCMTSSMTTFNTQFLYCSYWINTNQLLGTEVLMGQKQMSGYPGKPVNKWIYNNYEDKSFNWMYSEKRVDQDNHQFHCKVQYWQICIKKTVGSPSWFFVFFRVLQFILKVLVLLSGQ